MRSITIALLLFNHLVYSQEIRIDTNCISIGQQILLTISNNIDDTEIWPTFTDTITKDIEIIKIDKADTINDIIKQNIIITGWDSGSYYIPPIQFSKESSTEGLMLNIIKPNIQDDIELRDIKNPIKEPIGWNDIWPWLLSLVFLVIAFYIFKKYNTKEKNIKINKKPKKIIAPHIIALQELNKLKEHDFLTKNEIKRYYSIISEIIRRYIENRFNFIALELTTNEILTIINSKINKKNIDVLKILLEKSDLVKYAKFKPDNIENIKFIEIAIHFVESTKEKNSNE